jgi:antitoxin component of MazEF toxin-antitoxin module
MRRLTLAGALRRLARKWGFPAMPEIPADILAQLNAAEQALADAAARDDTVTTAQRAEADAQAALDAASEAALTAHQDANKKAGDAIAALRAHFGV